MQPISFSGQPVTTTFTSTAPPPGVTTPRTTAVDVKLSRPTGTTYGAPPLLGTTSTVTTVPTSSTTPTVPANSWLKSLSAETKRTLHPGASTVSSGIGRPRVVICAMTLLRRSLPDSPAS